jgi:4-amino-4-deoxy-L-arabinose transferase-like glycosyltransferase
MLRKIFVAALLLRWSYALLMFTLMGDAGLESVDSLTYLPDGHDFAAQIASGSLSGFQWLGPLKYTMPLAQWLFGVSALVFGAAAPLGYVLLQGVFDAGTCLLVYGIAQTLNKNYAAPAGFAAALNPTQIVLSGLALTDTPFVFFCALFLFAAVQWLYFPTWRWAVLLGLALGAAALIRVLPEPFAAVLLIFLPAGQFCRGVLSRRLIAQLAAAVVIFVLCVAPLLARNVNQFKSWSLSPEAGIYFALWVTPWVMQAADGTSWWQNHDEMQHRVDERYPTPAADLFEQSHRYQTVARDELVSLGIGPIAKTWLTGVAINLGSPGIILSPLISKLPRTGFYGTAGASSLDRVKNFLFHSDNATYAWIMLAGIAGVVVVRIVQAIGVFALFADSGQISVLLLFGLWIGYVLAVDGPMATPKYRLPIEPPLMVLTGAGLGALCQRRRAAAR